MGHIMFLGETLSLALDHARQVRRTMHDRKF
jgi:hypothetical protein